MEVLYDLNIAGEGNQAGGKFNKVRIAGKGTLNSDVEAKSVSANGQSLFRADLKAAEMTVAGECTVEGNVDLDRVSVLGTFKVRGNGRTHKLANKGKTIIGGNAKVHTVESYGKLFVDGSLEAEEFISRGEFQVKGLLNAHHVDIKLFGDSYANEIGGDVIRIERGRLVPVKIPFVEEMLPAMHKLEAGTIEGTEVVLENTVADVVRGHNVTIGPKCRIRTVECTGKLTVHPQSTVKNRI